jgi:hypothetical protein
MAEPDATQQPGAVRLIFEYEGDDVRLVSQQRVDVAVPGFDIALVPHPGHFVEVRDSDAAVLSRVPVREALSTSAEVFPEEHGEPIVRVELPERRGAFTVVVPARQTADRVALVEVRPPARGAVPLGAAATTPLAGEPEVVELASFQLAPDGGASP